MQGKVLHIDQEKCTGCRECELACSVFHTGVSNPSRARIKVYKWEWEGIYLPMTCQNCEDPFCVEVCPTKACHKDPELNRVVIDKNKCIGCKSCIVACPFGAPLFDKAEGITVKCNYCDGDPQCVRFCETNAILYIDASEINKIKQYTAAEKLLTTLPKTSTPS